VAQKALVALILAVRLQEQAKTVGYSLRAL